MRQVEASPGVSGQTRLAKAATLAVLGIPFILYPEPMIRVTSVVPGGEYVVPLALLASYYASLVVYAIVAALVYARGVPRPVKEKSPRGEFVWMGPGIAEYALILSLIAIVAILGVVFLGAQISTIISAVAGQTTPPP